MKGWNLPTIKIADKTAITHFIRVVQDKELCVCVWWRERGYVVTWHLDDCMTSSPGWCNISFLGAIWQSMKIIFHNTLFLILVTLFEFHSMVYDVPLLESCIPPAALTWTWVLKLCSTVIFDCSSPQQTPVKTSTPIVNFNSNSLTAHSFCQALCLIQLSPCTKSLSNCWMSQDSNLLIFSPAPTAIKLWSKMLAQHTFIYVCSLHIPVHLSQ